jgi:hypothetical protein
LLVMLCAMFCNRIVLPAFGGATISWGSHELLSELLRREAEDSVTRRSFAGLVTVSHDWCWPDFLKCGHPELEWALQTLAKFHKPGDSAPKCITSRVAPAAAVITPDPEPDTNTRVAELLSWPGEGSTSHGSA